MKILIAILLLFPHFSSAEDSMSRIKALHLSVGIMAWCDVKHGSKADTSFRDAGYEARMILELNEDWDTDKVKKVLTELKKRSFGGRDCDLAMEDSRLVVSRTLKDAGIDLTQLIQQYLYMREQKSQ
ncbi:hypothetical protein CWB85_18750 [Pseudoalteromonas sp. S1727]|uniref:hypothetical protein n=1 Tax=Pseudoalteromonas sp. S1727 TaxID=2066514 RepID=UPI00110839FB|nr:hypothetical protein [Pseudoalteromonas sp. S1727]TMN68092.1 hypothetical protein CWB85_18750 [Pseudoalteromonas sp. S1727]